MGKILLLALGLWLLLGILNKYRHSLDDTSTDAAKQQAVTDDMVPCAHCGVHVPLKESVQRDGKYYCCEAHSTNSQS